MNKATGNDTPMLRQYKEIKAQYEDTILFYRLGDFYEMFMDDARVASKALSLTLTGRGKDEQRIPMCGVPHHAAESYIHKLVKQGHKVAICEQVEDATASKGLTKRDVVKIITPGTVLSESALSEDDANYLAAAQDTGKGWAMAFIDISTGQFRLCLCSGESDLINLLDQLQIHELILADNNTGNLKLADSIYVSKRPFLNLKQASLSLCEAFKVSSLDAFGLYDLEHTFAAAAAILAYVEETQKQRVAHIQSPTQYHHMDHLILDKATRRSLELSQNAQDQSRNATLFWALNDCKTALGARRLKWLLHAPFVDKDKIERRLDAVGELKEDLLSREEIREGLTAIYDLERIVGRLSSGRHNPRDIRALEQSLTATGTLLSTLSHLDCRELTHIRNTLKPLQDSNSAISRLLIKIKEGLMADIGTSIREGNLFKAGYSQELDRLKASFKSVRDWIGNLESQEREATQIKSLKVRFNKVFGYYIEVPTSRQADVPQHYIRKQTLVNAERYVTPELKEKETVLLNGESQQFELEHSLYLDLIQDISGHNPVIQDIAAAIAELDVFQSLASIAQRHRYCRPIIVDAEHKTLNLKKSRHPIVERSDTAFIANDLYLDPHTHFILITGPNMAGKSTIMRQLALTIVMAQIGSYVAADAATLSITDRLFTRIGALDNLYAGQSTFMVEMIETANILNNATENSLIILDEIGRGTATYDGLSLAWALTEHICKDIKARTLFATHYHELTQLAQTLSVLCNKSMKITEANNRILFNYELIDGPADKSYGIHVAKMAGLPDSLIRRAGTLLQCFEEKGHGIAAPEENNQLSLF